MLGDNRVDSGCTTRLLCRCLLVGDWVLGVLDVVGVGVLNVLGV